MRADGLLMRRAFEVWGQGGRKTMATTGAPNYAHFGAKAVEAPFWACCLTPSGHTPSPVISSCAMLWCCEEEGVKDR
jgi:hypothetical protein